MDINYLSNSVFTTLKNYVEENSKYNAIVRKRQIEDEYPVVIFSTNSNQETSSTIDYYGLERSRGISFEIEIYAIDKGETPREIICEELENLVTHVMQMCYRMQGGTDAKINFVNDSHAMKVILHFNCEWTTKNLIY